MDTEVQIYNKSDESIVVYNSMDNAVQLEVQLSDENVWLTTNQMALLFDKDDSNIRRHIINIFNDGELSRENNVHFLHVNGVKKPVPFYNLDVIISVGYRVKSQRGVQFRQWANRILKEYLLRGYTVNPHLRYLEQRIDNKLQEHTEQIHELQNKVDFFIRTSLPPREGIFADGQIYDAYQFIQGLIKSAKKTILLIDNYIDESVLTMMSEKNNGVQVDIYTKDITAALQLAETRFNSQYGGLTLHQTNNIHDRFLILDDKMIYLIGASLKDAGKKLFAFTELDASMIAELKSKL
ncbi:MAG: virulence RhuM family protein [Paludibacteraceae bacterium]|nr:virulence RhuM family protein [Paludibacteraceae bacterium]